MSVFQKQCIANATTLLEYLDLHKAAAYAAGKEAARQWMEERARTEQNLWQVTFNWIEVADQVGSLEP